jgi:peptide/nickel transport system substrate-binding protein
LDRLNSKKEVEMKAKCFTKGWVMICLLSFILLSLSATGRVAAQTSAPRPTGELRIAKHDLETEALDPIKNSNVAVYYMNLLYDNFVGFDRDGHMDLTKGLAEKWEHSSDGMTHAFYLRKGIKFHNGDELTAEDVKFSWERQWSAGSLIGKGALKRLFKEIEIVNPYKLVVRCPQPIYLLPLEFTTGTQGCVVPKRYIMEKGEDYFLKHPVGTGPYKFVEQKHGSYIKFEANKDYWRMVPKWNSITFMIVPEESTGIVMLKTGEVDVVVMSLERVKEVKDAGFNIISKEGGAVHGLCFPEQWRPESATNDKRIREAISLAIDREEILKSLFFGYGTLGKGIPGGSWGFGYDADWKTPYDPEKARKLLQDAGYPGSFKNPRIKFYNVASANVPNSQMEGEAIAAELRGIGLQIETIPTDYATFRAKYVKRQLGPSVMFFRPTSNRRDVVGVMKFYLHSRGPGSLVADSRPALDALFAEVSGSKTEKELDDNVRKINRYVNENYITIPLIETDEVFGSRVEPWKMGKFTNDLGLWDLQAK